MYLRQIAVALSLWTTLAFSTGALAQADKDDAISLARAAAVLADSGKFAQALELFERAYTIDPAPILLGHMAMLCERTGNLKKSIEFYSRYIENESDSARVAKARERLVEIKKKLPGVLVISASPAGATFTVDKKTVTSGVPFEVAPGSHDVEAVLKGYANHQQKVDVPGGETVRVDLALKVLPGQIMVKGAFKGASVSVDGRSAGTLPMASPFPVASGRHVVTVSADGYERFVKSVDVGPGVVLPVAVEMEKLAVVQPVQALVKVDFKPEPIDGGVSAKGEVGRGSPWPWITIGTGAVALVAGGVMTGLAYTERTAVDDSQRSDGTVDGMTMTDAAGHVDQAETYDIISYAMYGVGGAALVAGIVMAAVMPKEKSTKATPVLGAAPLIGGAAVSASWNF